jgi:hypothetical protein
MPPYIFSYSPEFDKLEDPNMKFLRSVGSSASDAQFIPDPGTLDLSSNKSLMTEKERAAEDKRLRGVIRRSASEAMDRETESMVSAYASQLVTNDYFAQKTAEEIKDITNGHSQLWINDALPTIDPDLVPAVNVTAPITRFKQRTDTVIAYGPNMQIIQEYQGYNIYSI